MLDKILHTTKYRLITCVLYRSYEIHTILQYARWKYSKTYAAHDCFKTRGPKQRNLASVRKLKKRKAAPFHEVGSYLSEIFTLIRTCTCTFTFTCSARTQLRRTNAQRCEQGSTRVFLCESNNFLTSFDFHVTHCTVNQGLVHKLHHAR